MAIGGLNKDVIYEILLRLPIKSILRLKTVSKQWLSIVSCPRFRLIHTSVSIGSTTPTGLFLPKRHQKNPNQEEVEYDFLPLIKPYNPIRNSITPFCRYTIDDVRQASSSILTKNIITFCDYNGIGLPKTMIPFSKKPINIRSSSNGLLLLRSILVYHYPQPPPLATSREISFTYPNAMVGDPDRDYLVYNPTTKEFKPLVLPRNIRNSRYLNETLAFDPCKSPYYKVVFVYYHDLSNEFRIQIYSSETATFLSSPSPFLASLTDFSQVCGIYCNHAIHWTSYYRSSLYYYDLNTECMKELGLPPLRGKMSYFGESSGEILVVSGGEISIVDVFQLKKDCSWSLNYQVDLSSVQIERPNHTILNRKYEVLSIFFDQEEEDLIMVLTFHGYGEIFVSSLKNKPGNVLLYCHGYRADYWPGVHHYINTHACV